MRLDMLVRRKGVDPTAETCLHALRALMGLAVEAVEHGTLWRFELQGGDAAALKSEIARAACRAGRYVNTNRDAIVWLDEPAGAKGRPGRMAADVWIREGGGDDPVARGWFAPLLSAPLLVLRRGMLYRLWTAHEEPEAARRFALEVAVTRTRRQGLLMNPHVHSLEILAVAPAGGGEP
jgi:phosphoribosylformylglycinamidine (FGAM) synthase PurS component